MEGHLLLRPSLASGKRQPPEKRTKKHQMKRDTVEEQDRRLGRGAVVLEGTLTEAGKRRLPTHTTVGGHLGQAIEGVRGQIGRCLRASSQWVVQSERAARTTRTRERGVEARWSVTERARGVTGPLVGSVL